MTTLNLGQDWTTRVDAPNNRLIFEYEPNGTQFELNEDGTLAPLSGGVDTDLLNGADLSTATTGDVPQSDGAGNLTMAPVETEPNVPGWEEDGNSPQTFTNTSSFTYTLSGEYDEIKVKFRLTNDPAEITLQVNNETGATYNYREQSGATLNDQSSVSLWRGGNTSEFEMDGVWDVASGRLWGMNNSPKSANGDVAQSATNTDVLSPLTQFTFLPANPVSGVIEVYGRNIE